MGYNFVHSQKKLKKLYSVYSEGNQWAENASLAIAVYNKNDLDCISKNRIYNLFDTGIATGFLMLKATELGLIDHPIAGFSPRKVKNILDIPKDMDVIAMILVGKHDNSVKEKKSSREKTNRRNPQNIVTNLHNCPSHSKKRIFL